MADSRASVIVLIAFGVWLLYQCLRGRRESKEVNAMSNVNTYLLFLGLTLLNPVTIVYFTALILGLIAGTAVSFLDIILFVVGASSASLFWQTLLALISGLADKRLSPKLQFVMFALGDCLIILLGVLILIGNPI